MIASKYMYVKNIQKFVQIEYITPVIANNYSISSDFYDNIQI